MPTNLFTLAAELTLGIQKFSSGIREATNTGKSFADKLQMKANAVSVAVGNLISHTVIAAGRGFMGITKDAMKLTGDFEQALGGSEAVFGAWAENIQSEAQKAYKGIGLSANEYLNAANKLGSMLQGSGFTSTEAFQMTTEAMQRAADVASIMNVDLGSAMEAIAGMAKGNYTMMDNLAVPMNETALAAYAMEKGISKSLDKMSQTEKTQLAFQMFLDRTANYAGNFAKESGSLNGALQTLKASYDNLLLGTDGSVDAFVGSVSNAAKVSFDTLGKVVPRLASGMWEAVKGGWPKIKRILGEGVADAYNAGTQLIANLYNGLTGSTVTAENVQGFFSSLFSAAESAGANALSFVTDALQWIQDNQTAATVAIGAIATSLIALKAATDPTGTAIGLVVTSLGLIVTNWDSIKEGAKACWDAVIGFIDDAITKLKEWLGIDANKKISVSFQTPEEAAASGYTPEQVNAGIASGVFVPGHATGLNYVPYNDYPAYLHEGEAVLTKTQAAEWRSGGNQGGAAIDYTAIGQAVASALSGVQVNMDGQSVGALVAPAVSKAIEKDTKARRYTR